MRVPSQASDVDQFLDDLFNPVLDQLSDARSLAASIKGSSKSKSIEDFESFDPRDFAQSIKGGGRKINIDRPKFNEDNQHLEDEDVPKSSFDTSMFVKTIKGGGRGVASQQQVTVSLLSPRGVVSFAIFDIFFVFFAERRQSVRKRFVR